MSSLRCEHPVLAIGGVVVTGGGKIVVVKRAHEPLAGQWSLPGGRLELGETLAGGIEREVLEETGLTVEAGPVVEVVEHVTRDRTGAIAFHYVIVDLLCRVTGGTLAAGTDAAEVAAIDPSALDAFVLTDPARRVIRKGLELLPEVDWSP
jgi:ADP-ribose pyrophosphatase YjhB (NUDIX family)